MHTVVRVSHVIQSRFPKQWYEKGGHQLTDLHYEPDETKWILPHDNPPSITNHLGRAAPENRKHETPCPPPKALDHMDDECNAKERDENSIGG